MPGINIGGEPNFGAPVGMVVALVRRLVSSAVTMVQCRGVAGCLVDLGLCHRTGLGVGNGIFLRSAKDLALPRRPFIIEVGVVLLGRRTVKSFANARAAHRSL